MEYERDAEGRSYGSEGSRKRMRALLDITVANDSFQFVETCLFITFLIQKEIYTFS